MRFIHSILAGVTTAMILTANLSAHAQEEVLRGVSCFPIGSPPGLPFENLVKEINKRSAGVVKIDLLGGAPAIGSAFQVSERMALGAYDIVGCPDAFFGNLLPEAPVLRLAEVPYRELRQNGGLAYFEKIFNAKGATFLGRHHNDGPFNLFLNTPIDTPDLNGLNLRVSPTFTAFFKAMGATVQRSSMPEVYTLMENGTVDGYGWSLRGVPSTWFKVTNYRVEPGFYEAAIHTLANLKRWQSLSQNARDIVRAAVLDFEANNDVGSETLESLNTAARQQQADNGFKAITFEGADAEKWLNTARDEAWAEVLKLSPEHGPKLKKLFTK